MERNLNLKFTSMEFSSFPPQIIIKVQPKSEISIKINKIQHILQNTYIFNIRNLSELSSKLPQIDSKLERPISYSANKKKISKNY